MTKGIPTGKPASGAAVIAQDDPRHSEDGGIVARLDATDLRLIAALEENPRQTQSELASRLGLSRATIHSRLHRLLRSHIIRTVAVADPITVDNSTCVLLGVTTTPSQLVWVADQLAASPYVQHLMLCMGRFDIIAFTVFRKRADLLDFLVESVGSLDGVTHVETMLTLRHVKLMGPLLSDSAEPHLPRTPAPNLDSIDVGLIRELELDATQNTRLLADKLGTSQSTVLRKFQKLQDDRVIRIMTLTDPLALGYEGVASIGIRCDANKVNEAARIIASHREVQTVAICAGRYDIIAWVIFRELSDLSDFVTRELSMIPGLQYTETMTNLKIVKTPHRPMGKRFEVPEEAFHISA